MAWRMNTPPDYYEGQPIQDCDWGVVYRDETEPTMPEYVCILWTSRDGKSWVSGGINSFCPSTAKPEAAVTSAKARSLKRDFLAKDNIVWWGVIRNT